MDEYLIALFKLYEGLHRQGPGSTQSTIKALNFVRNNLPDNPNILDIGCGCGAQTVILAEELEGRITAVDIYEPYLNHLTKESKKKNLNSPINCDKQDMTELSFEPKSFDLIWSEGAIYIMGFENGLKSWQSFLKPGGFMVISELSWFNNDPPQEVLNYWQRGYPGMQSIENNISLARSANLEIVNHFSLPAEDWWTDYYNPLRKKIDGLTEKEKSSPGMEAVLNDTREEMEIIKKYSYFCGYEFFILRKS